MLINPALMKSIASNPKTNKAGEEYTSSDIAMPATYAAADAGELTIIS